MTAILEVDAGGRLVLPKSMRDFMQLQAGSSLRASIVGDRILLEREPAEAKLEKRGKRRVIVGIEGFDAAAAVRDMRDSLEDRAGALFRL
ncbi:MAG: AbrB/MazE/SpoVT family DNA-binding domain-containing protein [Verrucomicrobiaceae bacterium]|nr:AbrB/MazE/SpoVT family DNA-binding domain-containing protein [Verrucomicrobiaceae bacterium]